MTYTSLPCLSLTDEHEWLQKFSLTQEVGDEVNVSWSAHHAEKKRGLEFEMSITSLLPLLRDGAHSVATVRHSRDKVKDAISHRNPNQVPVITPDRPSYDVAKQVQWHWPDRYGEDRFVVMFGGLHIQMAAFRSLGTLLQNSGWTGALVEAGVASSGTADSFLSICIRCHKNVSYARGHSICDLVSVSICSKRKHMTTAVQKRTESWVLMTGVRHGEKRTLSFRSGSLSCQWSWLCFRWLDRTERLTSACTVKHCLL